MHNVNCYKITEIILFMILTLSTWRKKNGRVIFESVMSITSNHCHCTSFNILLSAPLHAPAMKVWKLSTICREMIFSLTKGCICWVTSGSCVQHDQVQARLKAFISYVSKQFSSIFFWCKSSFLFKISPHQFRVWRKVLNCRLRPADLQDGPCQENRLSGVGLGQELRNTNE